MDLDELKSQGFDSIRMPNIPSGVEICLYRPEQIEIVGLVYWNDQSISFNDLNGFSIELKLFNFLTKNREVLFDQPIEELDNNAEYKGYGSLGELCAHPNAFWWYCMEKNARIMKW